MLKNKIEGLCQPGFTGQIVSLVFSDTNFKRICQERGMFGFVTHQNSDLGSSTIVFIFQSAEN